MMVIALYGQSCVGKTTIAILLGHALGCKVRHCGELIKARCAALGCAANDLPSAEHAKLDDETRRIAGNTGADIVIEGSFLDLVLHESMNPALIHLTCSLRERERRYARCKGGSLDARDANDMRLRRELYATKGEREPDLEIDTGCLSAVEVGDRINAWLKNQRV